MSVKNIIRILSAILLISTITNTIDASMPPDRGPTLMSTHNYQNISINDTYILEYTFDKINYIETSLYANRDNYSLEYVCSNDGHPSYYAIHYRCMQNCTFYLDTEYFTNQCRLIISTSTIYNHTLIPLQIFDMNVTINYDGLEKNPPTPVPTPVPIPSVPETPSPLGQEMLSPGAIAGIVFGVVLFLALVIIGIYFLVKHFSEKPNDNYARE